MPSFIFLLRFNNINQIFSFKTRRSDNFISFSVQFQQLLQYLKLCHFTVFINSDAFLMSEVVGKTIYKLVKDG